MQITEEKGQKEIGEELKGDKRKETVDGKEEEMKEWKGKRRVKRRGKERKGNQIKGVE